MESEVMESPRWEQSYRRSLLVFTVCSRVQGPAERRKQKEGGLDKVTTGIQYGCSDDSIMGFRQVQGMH